MGALALEDGICYRLTSLSSRATIYPALTRPGHPSLGQLHEDVIQALGDAPARIVQLHLVQIADVTDVITLACSLDVLPVHALSGQPLHTIERLENRAGVVAPTTAVVHLGDAWFRDELL